MRFEESDLEFHVTLAGIAGNPIFSALLAAFTATPGRRIRRGPPGSAEGDEARVHEEAYREHVRVFRAIAAGDPEGAASAMDAHLSRSPAAARRPEPGPVRRGPV